MLAIGAKWSILTSSSLKSDCPYLIWIILQQRYAVRVKICFWRCSTIRCEHQKFVSLYLVLSLLVLYLLLFILFTYYYLLFTISHFPFFFSFLVSFFSVSHFSRESGNFHLFASTNSLIWFWYEPVPAIITLTGWGSICCQTWFCSIPSSRYPNTFVYFG